MEKVLKKMAQKIDDVSFKISFNEEIKKKS